MANIFDATAITNAVTNNEASDRQEMSFMVFSNAQYGQIRVVMRGNAPWFVAKDVCDCLGTATNNLPAILDDDERGIYTIDTLSGPQQMTIISEPGLYSLILRSRKPEAKAFKRWVTHDVLPSIRKTGSYSIAGIPVPRFDSPADAARAWADQYEARVLAEKTAAYEAARADLAIAAKGRIVAGRDQRLMLQRHEDLRTIRRKDDRNGRLESRLVEQGIELGAERTRADKAENALGIGKTYRCVTNIPWFRDVFDLKNCKANVVYQQAGRRLKKLSDEMGYGYQTVPGHRFDAKAYHVDVIAEFRIRLADDPDLMGPYRK